MSRRGKGSENECMAAESSGMLQKSIFLENSFLMFSDFPRENLLISECLMLVPRTGIQPVLLACL